MQDMEPHVRTTSIAMVTAELDWHMQAVAVLSIAHKGRHTVRTALDVPRHVAKTLVKTLVCV